MYYNIKDFAIRLRAARKRCGLKQSETYDKLSVSPSTYSAWETGRKYPTVEKLEELSSLLNTNPTFLLAGNISGLDKIQLYEAIVSATSFLEVDIKNEQLAKFAELVAMLYGKQRA